MISDSEIARRLHELAEAGGPWDDPLPAIRRRAANTDGADAAGANGASNVLQLPMRSNGPASEPGSESPTSGRPGTGGRSASKPTATADDAGGENDDSATGWDAKVLRPDRRRFGWKVPAAAAAVVAGISGVVGLARLMPGSDSSKSASTSGSSFTISASGAQRNPTSAAASSAASAGAAGGSAASSAGGGAVPAATSTSAASRAGYAPLSCSSSVRHTSAVRVRAPAQVRAGSRLSAAVSIGANLRRQGIHVEIYVVGARSNAVVGALRGTLGGSVSSATRSPATRSAAALRGTLRRWSCADGNAPSRSSVPGRPLPAGLYRLVAVLLPADAATPVVSVPVPVHILSATK